MQSILQQKLATFRDQNRVTSKGKLSVVLHISRLACQEGLPLDPGHLRTMEQGQVRGLSRSSVQAVLAEYGIRRTLAQEGGRTSRGSIGLMERYVAFLNGLPSSDEVDLQTIEAWWVDQIRGFFASQPFILRQDTGVSIRSVIAELLAQARQRQAQNPGTTYEGTVLQHLVGAKLEMVFRDRNIPITHHGASVADAPTDRDGDFVIGRGIIHVTTHPTPALLQKCKSNLSAGHRPIIITTPHRMAGIESLAEIEGILQDVEILAADQFIATNLHEFDAFEALFDRNTTFQDIVEQYNRIIDAHETDPSLRIRIGR